MGNDIFNLKGFDDVRDTVLTNELTDNLIEFFDWGLLQKGNYISVGLDDEASQLKLSDHRSFAQGSAWEGNSNWVWQSGVAYDPPPTPISGVYVDQTFYPSDTTGAYSHSIDYYNGRVVFDLPISPNAEVRVPHSYRWIHVDYASEEGGIEYVDRDDAKVPEMLNHLPSISVEVIDRPKSVGYQLGGGHILTNTAMFYCLADNASIRNRLIDMVSYQNDKTLIMFDTDRIAASGDMPIKSDGQPIENAKNYRELVINYPGYKYRLTNCRVSEMQIKGNELFGGVVRFDVEVIKNNI